MGRHGDGHEPIAQRHDCSPVPALCSTRGGSARALPSTSTRGTSRQGARHQRSHRRDRATSPCAGGHALRGSDTPPPLGGPMIYRPSSVPSSAPMPYGGSQPEFPYGRDSTAVVFSDEGDGLWGFFDPGWVEDGKVRGQLRINISSPTGHGGLGAGRRPPAGGRWPTSRSRSLTESGWRSSSRSRRVHVKNAGGSQSHSSPSDAPTDGQGRLLRRLPALDTMRRCLTDASRRLVCGSSASTAASGRCGARTVRTWKRWCPQPFARTCWTGSSFGRTTKVSTTGTLPRRQRST